MVDRADCPDTREREVPAQSRESLHEHEPVSTYQVPPLCDPKTTNPITIYSQMPVKQLLYMYAQEHAYTSTQIHTVYVYKQIQS